MFVKPYRTHRASNFAVPVASQRVDGTCAQPRLRRHVETVYEISPRCAQAVDHVPQPPRNASAPRALLSTISNQVLDTFGLS